MNDNTILGAIIGGALVWWYLKHRAGSNISASAINAAPVATAAGSGGAMRSVFSSGSAVDAAGYPVPPAAANPCGSC